MAIPQWQRMDLGPPIGKRIAALMKARGLTQKELAFEAGVSQPTISGLVTGSTKDPPIGSVLRIAAALKVSLKDLLPVTFELHPEDGSPFGAYDRAPLVVSLDAETESLGTVVGRLEGALQALDLRVGKLEGQAKGLESGGVARPGQHQGESG